MTFILPLFGEIQSMNACVNTLKAALNERKAVKIIAGIANLDLENVLQVVRAAEAAGATAVDVAAHPGIVKAAKAATQAAVFASSVDPQALASAVAAGADVAELGNFDALYDQGLFLSAEEVLALAAQTVALVKGQALISITVPGHLTLESQIRLATQLEALGIDIIQTEGASRVLSAEPTAKSLSQAEKEIITLMNTRALVKATHLPIMTASGMTENNVDKAFAAGASAVGVGSFVNQADTEAEMIQCCHAVMAASRHFVSLAC
jgi:2-keto-3-deoxy-6-phosphogluconate aldolase